MSHKFSRRKFLRNSILGTGAMTLGFPALNVNAQEPKIRVSHYLARFGGNLTGLLEEINKLG